jgi:hypothetical protein
MEINPGGQLDIHDIVGRENEMDRYWEILGRQGLVLSAERRIGKTQILRKMHANGYENFVTFYQQLEGVHGSIELIGETYRSIQAHLPRTKKLKAKAIEAWDGLMPQRIGALEVPKANENWKHLLTNAIEDVLDVTDPKHKIVLMWDEFPLMLYNIRRREGAERAIHLLDQLRHLRHVHCQRLRFLFTGSIGLHLVLKQLRDDGNANDPINDMLKETVPPMNHVDSVALAEKLLSRLRPVPEDPRPIAEAITDAVEGFPYFVQWVADHLSQLHRKVVAKDVDRAVEALVFADNDPANIGYYANRIQRYYDKAEAALAFVVLDTLAAQKISLPLENLMNLVRHKVPEATDEQIKGICQLLRQDHYLTLERGDDGPLYGFRWKLIKRWWRENRL